MKSGAECKKVFIRAKSGDQVEAAINYLESLGCTGGWYSKVNVPSISEAIVGDWKGDISWAADIDYLVDGGYKEIFMLTKHKHYDALVKWLKDPLQGVWAKIDDKWVEIDVTTLVRDAIGHHVEIRVQHESPKRKIMIGDAEIDAPEVVGLEYGDHYFLPNQINLEFYNASTWYGDNDDDARLKRGLIHLNKEAAIAHAKALLKERMAHQEGLELRLGNAMRDKVDAEYRARYLQREIDARQTYIEELELRLSILSGVGK